MSTINIKGKGRHVIESGPCVVTGVRLSSANRTGFSLKTSTGRHQSVGMVTNRETRLFSPVRAVVLEQDENLSVELFSEADQIEVEVEVEVEVEQESNLGTEDQCSK